VSSSPQRPQQSQAGFGRMMGGPMPVARIADFRGTTRRLLGMLRPDRTLMLAAIVLGVVSVALAVIGLKVLGHATDLIFSGLVSKQLPAGVTADQAAQRLREQGNGNVANMVQAMHVTPGAGIDFGAVGHVLLIVLGIYVAAAALSYMQGRLTTIAVQRAAFRLREQVELKLSRLPLSYFDQQPRGELLSRATNDTDNVAQTLQQTLSQLITSVLTVIGVLAMMIWLAPILASIALVTIPVSIFVTMAIAKRSRPQFTAQWATTGRLNAHIEEMFTGHALVKVFGREQEAAELFRKHNQSLYESSFKAQFISGITMPATVFFGNLNYVLIAVVGGLRIASGSLSLGDVQAFIQYSRQFTQPLTQVASMMNLVQSGVASAERIFELLDAPEQSRDPVAPAYPAVVRGHVAFEHVSFRYNPDRPLIEDLSLKVQSGQTIAIVGPTGAGKTTLVNLLMRFYEVSSGRILLDGVDTARMSRADLRSNISSIRH